MLQLAEVKGCVGPGLLSQAYGGGTNPWLESKTIPVTEDAREDTP
jgi:hypothetical protein